MVYDTNSDGFELKFPDLSQAELKGCNAKPSPQYLHLYVNKQQIGT